MSHPEHWGLRPSFWIPRPSLVVDLHRAVVDARTQFYILDDRPLWQVRVCGTIVAYKPYEEWCKVLVDDGTGVLECHLWFLHLTTAELHQLQQLGAAVRLVGKLREHEFRGDVTRSLSVRVFSGVETENGVLFHWLQCLAVAESKNRGPFDDVELDQVEYLTSLLYIIRSDIWRCQSIDTAVCDLPFRDPTELREGWFSASAVVLDAAAPTARTTPAHEDAKHAIPCQGTSSEAHTPAAAPALEAAVTALMRLVRAGWVVAAYPSDPGHLPMFRFITPEDCIPSTTAALIVLAARHQRQMQSVPVEGGTSSGGGPSDLLPPSVRPVDVLRAIKTKQPTLCILPPQPMPAVPHESEGGHASWRCDPVPWGREQVKAVLQWMSGQGRGGLISGEWGTYILDQSMLEESLR